MGLEWTETSVNIILYTFLIELHKTYTVLANMRTENCHFSSHVLCLQSYHVKGQKIKKGSLV